VLKPSWDIQQVLWVVDDTAVGAHLFAVVEGKPREVYARGITGRPVDSIAVSRDGVRLAAIVGRHEDRHLVVSVIERDPADGGQVTMRPAQQIYTSGSPSTSLSTVSWLSPTSVVVLADDESGEPKPTEINIDGSPTLDSRFPGFLPVKPVAVAAGPNEDLPTAIVDRVGQVYEQTVTTEWVQVGGSAPIRAPFYPG
jgi:hypothetical protein